MMLFVSGLIHPSGKFPVMHLSTLEEVELHDNLNKICPCAFSDCTALKRIVFPSGLSEIENRAFWQCAALKQVHVSDGVRRVGGGAFGSCNFTKFRFPPLITTISDSDLNNCQRMFSLELPENIFRLKRNACSNCRSLRNVALASNTVFEDDTDEDEGRAFNDMWDLWRIFITQEDLMDALMNRFDELPIHGFVYYISYHNTMTTNELLNIIIIGENSELDPTGLYQDCLGMTPLHILACSTVQRLELYQLITEKYPDSMIVKDAWGATPLLYAVWGEAPSEIVEFLINSYLSLYPDNEFDWDGMMVTLGRADASEDVMQNMLNIQQTISRIQH